MPNSSNNNHQSNDEHPLHSFLRPKAEATKIVIQMLIGFGVVVLVMLQLAFLVCPPDQEIWKLLAKRHPLEITGYALAVSACVELAYMLYTHGPDEAIDPLILGFSAAALIEVSRGPIAKYEVAAIVFVLTAGIGFLFWVKNRIAGLK